MTDMIISDKQLSSSVFSHVINVPIEKVDIADWLFKLSVAEYQRCCPPDHIACGATSTDDGKPMSIHVEMIGRTLMIQHYVAETATPTFCRMVSVSDAFMPNGANAGASDLDPQREAHRRRKLEYTNSVAAHPTAQFMKFIAEHKISFENAVVAPQRFGRDHNRRETPLLAASI